MSIQNILHFFYNINNSALCFIFLIFFYRINININIDYIIMVWFSGQINTIGDIIKWSIVPFSSITVCESKCQFSILVVSDFV